MNLRQLYRKLFKNKKKYKQTADLINANNYLDKYFEETEFASNPKEETAQEKIIWQMWLQGEQNAPTIVKKCLNSIKTHCSDYKIIVLDLNTIEKYITIPAHIWAKYRGGEFQTPIFQTT